MHEDIQSQYVRIWPEKKLWDLMKRVVYRAVVCGESRTEGEREKQIERERESIVFRQRSGV